MLDALYDEHKLDLRKARAAIAVAEDAVRHVKGVSSQTLIAELVQLRADIRRLRLKREEGDEDTKKDAESLGCVAARGSRRSFVELQAQVQEANKQVAIAVKSEHQQALALEKTQKECNALRQECQRLQRVSAYYNNHTNCTCNCIPKEKSATQTPPLPSAPSAATPPVSPRAPAWQRPVQQVQPPVAPPAPPDAGINRPGFHRVR